MKDNIIKIVLGVFLSVLAVLIAVAVTAVQQIRKSTTTSDWVNQTHAVILEVDAIWSSLNAGEAALRSYLLTGDARDQAACREAFNQINEHVDVAKSMTRSEPGQADAVIQLEPLLVKRAVFTREIIKTRQQTGLEAAQTMLAEDTGRASIGEIKRLVQKIKDENNVLLQQRDKAAFLEAQTTRSIIFVGVGINFVLLIMAAWVIRDDIDARRRAARALEDANAHLEGEVQKRTAELVQANQALQDENLERRWANQSLEHQLRYSQLIINSINEPILVVSKAMNVIRVNNAAVHHSGLESQVLIGSPLAKVLRLDEATKADVDSKTDLIARALREGHELQQKQGVLIALTGGTYPVMVNVFPVRDQDKVVGGVITMHLLKSGSNQMA